MSLKVTKGLILTQCSPSIATDPRKRAQNDLLFCNKHTDNILKLCDQVMIYFRKLTVNKLSVNK